MKKKYIIFLLIFLSAIATIAAIKSGNKRENRETTTKETQTETTDQSETNDNSSKNGQSENNGLALPIAGFHERITKKSFGTYVSPANSPVSPERFTGYHTAVDVEYGDVMSDVPVYAIADGQIVSKRAGVQGYGGLVVVRHAILSEERVVIYGHLDPKSFPVGNRVEKGEKIGILGDAFSEETDGERKHLHLGVRRDNQEVILGYVQNRSQLDNWLNPLDLFK